MSTDYTPAKDRLLVALAEWWRAVLEEEKGKAFTQSGEWLCSECRVVYPGPPQKGFACVQCPKCGGNTGPRQTILLRESQAELAELKRRVERAVSVLRIRNECERSKIADILEGKDKP